MLVVQHEDDAPPGLLAGWLDAAGVEVDVLLAHRGRSVPVALTDHDALVVLGGEMGALDDDVAPWLPAVRSLIAGTVGAGLPFLGICLGHQMGAAALGGTVRANPAGQAEGVTPWCPTAAGHEDPLLGVVGAAVPCVQWNGDIVLDLPPGATVLARSPDGAVQAARYGPRAWGVQPHPEATAAIFRSWTTDKPGGGAPRPDGIDIRAVAQQIEDRSAELAREWEPFGRRFAEIVTELRSPERSRGAAATSGSRKPPGTARPLRP